MAKLDECRLKKVKEKLDLWDTLQTQPETLSEMRQEHTSSRIFLNKFNRLFQHDDKVVDDMIHALRDEIIVAT